MEAQILHTERPDRLLESPIKCRLEKLCKATSQACTEPDILREIMSTRQENVAPI
jgi:hypothetical protein